MTTCNNVNITESGHERNPHFSRCSVCYSSSPDLFVLKNPPCWFLKTLSTVPSHNRCRYRNIQLSQKLDSEMISTFQTSLEVVLITVISDWQLPDSPVLIPVDQIIDLTFICSAEAEQQQREKEEWQPAGGAPSRAHEPLHPPGSKPNPPLSRLDQSGPSRSVSVSWARAQPAARASSDQRRDPIREQLQLFKMDASKKKVPE